jgi:hypothetical protein
MTEAPAPPHGPGVVPLFPAPPTEGRGRRIGVGLGVAGGLVLVICGGGLVAGIGLVSSFSSAANEQAHKVIGDYLDDIRDKHYNQAWAAQCQKERDAESQADFADRVSQDQPIVSYSVGAVDLTSVDPAVPVDVTYRNGQSGKIRVYLGQDRSTGDLQVCGVEE